MQDLGQEETAGSREDFNEELDKYLLLQANPKDLERKWVLDHGLRTSVQRSAHRPYFHPGGGQFSAVSLAASESSLEQTGEDLSRQKPATSRRAARLLRKCEEEKEFDQKHNQIQLTALEESELELEALRLPQLISLLRSKDGASAPPLMVAAMKKYQHVKLTNLGRPGDKFAQDVANREDQVRKQQLQRALLGATQFQSNERGRFPYVPPGGLRQVPASGLSLTGPASRRHLKRLLELQLQQQQQQEEETKAACRGVGSRHSDKGGGLLPWLLEHEAGSRVRLMHRTYFSGGAM